MLLHKLQSVPAINKQELLLFLKTHQPSTTIKIVTNSGQNYHGVVLNVGKAVGDDFILTLQIVSIKNEVTQNVLHLSITKIESIEIFNEAETILSLGKIDLQITYEESSKIETQRHLQNFAETIQIETTITVGIPEIALPENRKSLNRIIKLTSSIQTVIIEILKADDAKNSWKSSYTSIKFIENNTLEVKRNMTCLEIHFSFNDIEAKEINVIELRNQLFAVL
jgi:hypothetical protein